MIPIRSIPLDFDFKEGCLFLVNKPKTWSSFDVVNKIRYRIKGKVGHAGTLDPLATGLLLICAGKFTKKIESLQGLPKQYLGQIKLGESTPTYDSEAEADETMDVSGLSKEAILENTQPFIGDILQKPPKFSAIKKNGVALYKLARKGIEMPEPEPRRVSISRFDIEKIDMPYVDFVVDCSKGTYIRSLAHDFGKSLGNVAHLSKLVRSKVGEFHLDDAWELDDLIAELDKYQQHQRELSGNSKPPLS